MSELDTIGLECAARKVCFSGCRRDVNDSLEREKFPHAKLECIFSYKITKYLR